MTEESNERLKLVLIGDQKVGKSCLLTRFVDDTFSDSYISTIGVDFRSYRMKNLEKPISLQIWDTSGQERFRSLITSYLKGAVGILIVFDLTDVESFNNVDRWVQDINTYSNDNVKKVLIGNKCDLTAERVIDFTKAKELADSFNIPYIETSAKCSTNVEQAFKSLVADVNSIPLANLTPAAKHNFKASIESLDDSLAQYLPYDHLYKLVLVGDSGVGKSSLLIRFTDEKFTESFLPTIGVDFKTRTMKHNEKTIKLQIWDTAGQERFRSITSSYYKGSNGAIIVFDLTRKETFESINTWLREIDRYRVNEMKILLIGNKCDLIDARVIDQETAKKFADSLNISYIETSAKDSTNVEQIFKTMIDQLKPVERPVITAGFDGNISSQKKSSKFC